mmetsp:Transcript_7444/g.26581  ORF Transcript_7444/g.26581 Transcript_7444/m.26581 type:complete len:1882 (+) Transcript_7444:1849-7494(+)
MLVVADGRRVDRDGVDVTLVDAVIDDGDGGGADVTRVRVGAEQHLHGVGRQVRAGVDGNGDGGRRARRERHLERARRGVTLAPVARGVVEVQDDGRVVVVGDVDVDRRRVGLLVVVVVARRRHADGLGAAFALVDVVVVGGHRDVLEARPVGRLEQQLSRVKLDVAGTDEVHRHLLVRVGRQADGERGRRVRALLHDAALGVQPPNGHVRLVDVRHIHLDLAGHEAGRAVHGVVGRHRVRDHEALDVRLVAVVGHARDGDLLRRVPVARREGHGRGGHVQVLVGVVLGQVDGDDDVGDGLAGEHELVRHARAVLDELDRARRGNDAGLVVLRDRDGDLHREPIVEGVRATGSELDGDVVRYVARVDVVVVGGDRDLNGEVAGPFGGVEREVGRQGRARGALAIDVAGAEGDERRRLRVEGNLDYGIFALLDRHSLVVDAHARFVRVDDSHVLRVHLAVEDGLVAHRRGRDGHIHCLRLVRVVYDGGHGHVLRHVPVRRSKHQQLCRQVHLRVGGQRDVDPVHGLRGEHETDGGVGAALRRRRVALAVSVRDLKREAGLECLAVGPREAVPAIARVLGDAVDARGAILARLRQALVDVVVAAIAGEAVSTVARVLVDAVNALGAVQAQLGGVLAVIHAVAVVRVEARTHRVGRGRAHVHRLVVVGANLAGLTHAVRIRHARAHDHLAAVRVAHCARHALAVARRRRGGALIRAAAARLDRLAHRVLAVGTGTRLPLAGRARRARRAHAVGVAAACRHLVLASAARRAVARAVRHRLLTVVANVSRRAVARHAVHAVDARTAVQARVVGGAVVHVGRAVGALEARRAGARRVGLTARQVLALGAHAVGVRRRVARRRLDAARLAVGHAVGAQREGRVEGVAGLAIVGEALRAAVVDLEAKRARRDLVVPRARVGTRHGAGDAEADVRLLAQVAARAPHELSAAARVPPRRDLVGNLLDCDDVGGLRVRAAQALVGVRATRELGDKRGLDVGHLAARAAEVLRDDVQRARAVVGRVDEGRETTRLVADGRQEVGVSQRARHRVRVEGGLDEGQVRGTVGAAAAHDGHQLVLGERDGVGSAVGVGVGAHARQALRRALAVRVGRAAPAGGAACVACRRGAAAVHVRLVAVLLAVGARGSEREAATHGVVACTLVARERRGRHGGRRRDPPARARHRVEDAVAGCRLQQRVSAVEAGLAANAEAIAGRRGAHVRRRAEVAARAAAAEPPGSHLEGRLGRRGERRELLRRATRARASAAREGGGSGRGQGRDRLASGAQVGNGQKQRRRGRRLAVPALQHGEVVGDAADEREEGRGAQRARQVVVRHRRRGVVGEVGARPCGAGRRVRVAKKGSHAVGVERRRGRAIARLTRVRAHTRLGAALGRLPAAQVAIAIRLDAAELVDGAARAARAAAVDVGLVAVLDAVGARRRLHELRVVDLARRSVQRRRGHDVGGRHAVGARDRAVEARAGIVGRRRLARHADADVKVDARVVAGPAVHELAAAARQVPRGRLEGELGRRGNRLRLRLVAAAARVRVDLEARFGEGRLEGGLERRDAAARSAHAELVGVGAAGQLDGAAAAEVSQVVGAEAHVRDVASQPHRAREPVRVRRRPEVLPQVVAGAAVGAAVGDAAHERREVRGAELLLAAHDRVGAARRAAVLAHARDVLAHLRRAVVARAAAGAVRAQLGAEAARPAVDVRLAGVLDAILARVDVGGVVVQARRRVVPHALLAAFVGGEAVDAGGGAVEALAGEGGRHPPLPTADALVGRVAQVAARRAVRVRGALDEPPECRREGHRGLGGNEAHLLVGAAVAHGVVARARAARRVHDVVVGEVGLELLAHGRVGPARIAQVLGRQVQRAALVALGHVEGAEAVRLVAHLRRQRREA